MIKEGQFLKDRVQGSSSSGYSYSPMLAAPQIDSDFIADFSKDNLVRSSIPYFLQQAPFFPFGGLLCIIGPSSHEQNYSGLHVGLPQPPVISGGFIHATLGVTGKGVSDTSTYGRTIYHG